MPTSPVLKSFPELAGDGRFAYVQDSSEVAGVLGRELETMLHVYARNVRLRIQNVDGAPKAEDEMCGLVQNYGIPDGNPFFEADGCDEISTQELPRLQG